MRSHEHRLSDSRSMTHLQVVSMLLASHDALLPWLRNEGEVIAILREQNGAKVLPALRFLSYFGVLCRRILLGRDEFAQMAGMQRGLLNDLGSAFEAQQTVNRQHSEVQIRRCLYHDVLAAEDRLQLLQACCCSQDAVWFDGLHSHGVSYKRLKWLGNGDECCQVRVQKIP